MLSTDMGVVTRHSAPKKGARSIYRQRTPNTIFKIYRGPQRLSLSHQYITTTMMFELLSLTLFMVGISAQTISTASKPYPLSFLLAADT
jgi:hypothetical protein